MDCIFWIEAGQNQTLAFLAIARENISREPEAAALDDLISGLYEGEEFWYLDKQDAYGILESGDNRHMVSLFNHERVLSSFAVDAEWVRKASDTAGFGLILTLKISPEATRGLSREQLIKARDENLLELVAVGVNISIPI